MKDVMFLQRNGFKKTYCDDKSSFWMQKNIDHPLLINCQVLIDKHITVYCQEPENYREGNFEIVICELDDSRDNFNRVMSFLGLSSSS